jgi:hypothetical protein
MQRERDLEFDGRGLRVIAWCEDITPCNGEASQHTMGIFAQPLEPVHYAEKECWSDWGLSVGLRYR